MICVEDWAEIRRLHRAEQMPIRAIARHLGISKNTVKRALASDRPPKYERPTKGSVVDAVEAQIRELLRETPTMPATVIAERIGWERGMTVLKERVRELRPAYVPVDPVSRTTYQPGELAQCDLWFPEADIPSPGHRRHRPGLSTYPPLPPVSRRAHGSGDGRFTRKAARPAGPPIARETWPSSYTEAMESTGAAVIRLCNSSPETGSHR